MALIDHYLVLRQAHILLATASVCLFVVRGAGVLWDAAWPMQAAVRGLSVAVDCLLLLAGLLLAWMLPGIEVWLPLKLGLLVAYIVLGSLALKRARTRLGKLMAFAAALACIGLIVGVARAHHPWGWWV